jgi:polyisoprenoid-binding protein YceI
MATATQSFAGVYDADPIHSSFGFAVRHMGVSTFRGTLTDVHARLTASEQGLALEGAARVESISITTPAEFRAHVLGEEFFDAERHPEVTFRSTQIALGDDGTARVHGELTIKGITRPIEATGSYVAPVQDPYGHTRAALELEAEIDRREFGMTWNAPLPNGGNALAEQVRLVVHLELVAA